MKPIKCVKVPNQSIIYTSFRCATKEERKTGILLSLDLIMERLKGNNVQEWNELMSNEYNNYFKKVMSTFVIKFN